MNEDLTTFIEPELEARIVAMILGEASAFEQEELERIIEERPEVRLFKNRVAELHGLVEEASNPVDASSWKLSSERRETVLAKVREERPVIVAAPAPKKGSNFRRRLIFYGSAACFIAIVGGLSTPAVLKSSKSAIARTKVEEMPQAMEMAPAQRVDSLMEAPGPVGSSSVFRAKNTDDLEKKQAGARAGDLLASLDGDYSLETPVLELGAASDSRNRDRNGRGNEAMRAKESKEPATYASNGKVNVRDGGLQRDLAAELNDQISDHFVSGNEGGRERIADNQRGLLNQGFPVTPATPVEGVDATGWERDEYSPPELPNQVGRGMAADKELYAQLPADASAKPSAEPVADEAGLGLNRAGISGADDGLDLRVAGKPADEADPLRGESPAVTSQPAAPSSSMSKVIAANTASPEVAAVPLPAIVTEFGDGDEFGDGWAGTDAKQGSNGFLGGGAIDEEDRRANSDFIGTVDRVQIPGIPNAPGQSVAGIVTAGNRSGAAAVDRKSVDAILNRPERNQVQGRTKLASGQWVDVDLKSDGVVGAGGGGGFIEGEADPFASADGENLGDGSLALSQVYRRTGKYEEARELLSALDKIDPGNEDAKKGLEYLDDPIRTNPALTYEHTKNIDKVRRNLYTGEGFYDLGQYDKAEESFKEVLRTDPYNKAARRGLERTAAIKSDYHRAAYDHTRAEMLHRVDEAWELESPPLAETSDADGLESKAGDRGPDLEGITLSKEDSARLAVLGEQVQEKRKELTVQIQQYGIPYFDGRSSSPVGATEEEIYRHSQKTLNDYEAQWEDVETKLQKLSGSDDSEENQKLAEALKVKQTVLERQVGKMKEIVDNKQGVTVDLSLKQHNYNQTKEDYSAKLDEYRKLRSELAAKGAPAREVQRKKEAILAEIDDALPGDDSIAVAIIDDVDSVDLLAVQGLNRKSEVAREWSEEKIESIPLYVDGVASDEKTQATSKKLNEIILPELNLANVTVGEAMAIIKEKAKEADVSGVDEFSRGVEFQVRTPKVPDEDGAVANLNDESGLGGGGDPNAILIEKLDLRNVPLRVALQYVADEAKLRYKVGEEGVTLLPSGADDVADIVQRRFDVPDGFETFLSNYEADIDVDDDDPFGGGVESSLSQPMGIMDLLKNNGVIFPLNTSAAFLENSNTLIVRNTPTNLELVDLIIKAAQVEASQTQEEQKKKQIEFDTFETSVAEKSDSTFSLNVSDVSFKLAQSSLANGQWPEAEKVRPEEFVNALSYGDDTPTQAEKVACVIEQGSHPFMQQRNLMRVSMSTAALGRNASTPLRLTVLLDQSGSMERADRAESVRRAFALLTSQLNANDEITLIGFARTPRLLAERVKGDESGKLTGIVSNPLTEGGTNLEAALSSGLQLAKQQFVEGAQNRIILLTDGAANLGDALPENLAKQVSQMRDAGIAFDACGVGADGLNDEILTSLTKQGDGRYYFLDRPEDADEGFARQIAGALRPAAKNVKVQVIFNPERVSKFKLYGFEKHKLKKEDFRNDSVDAAEMAAEESGVALYHFQPLPEGRGDIGTVSVRFLDTATNQMVERTWTIPYQPDATAFSDAHPNLRLASVAGLFAEKLKGSPVGAQVELKRLRQEIELLKPTFRNQTRFQEFQTMLQQAGE